MLRESSVNSFVGSRIELPNKVVLRKTCIITPTSLSDKCIGDYTRKPLEAPQQEVMDIIAQYLLISNEHHGKNVKYKCEIEYTTSTESRETKAVFYTDEEEILP